MEMSEERKKSRETGDGRTDGRHGLGAFFPIKVTHTDTESTFTSEWMWILIGKFETISSSKLEELKVDICPYKCFRKEPMEQVRKTSKGNLDRNRQSLYEVM